MSGELSRSDRKAEIANYVHEHELQLKEFWAELIALEAEIVFEVANENFALRSLLTNHGLAFAVNDDEDDQ